MSDNSSQAAIQATAQLITDDDAFAVEAGTDRIPPDEVIVEPDPSDYIPPPYLQKTAPQLAPAFGELLNMLRRLNAQHIGERTVEVQATLSLTGEHEWLEEKFLAWCQRYFRIRGSLDRLNPTNGNDPWRLYCECYQEFRRLLEKRIMQQGSINSSVLNLSQRFMVSQFADEVLGPDLKDYDAKGFDRFGNNNNRCNAIDLARGYQQQVEEFTDFLTRLAKSLPTEYLPNDSAEWLVEIQSKVARCAEDLDTLRSALCVKQDNKADVHQLLPDLWARLRWDVYHGCVVAAVLTSPSQQASNERATEHLLAFRRDGWLCNREYPWLRVQPDYLSNERRSELAVSWYLLDTLASPLYAAWDLLDLDATISRGLETEASDEEQIAAMTVALTESDPSDTVTPLARKTRHPLPQIRLSKFEKITTDYFQCEWSQAKGSERKVFRQGGRHFTFGCHGSDRAVHSAQIKRCLKKLEITVQEFLAACR